ncbi:MAG: glycerate kinase, partial [Spirochaetota bacterium]
PLGAPAQASFAVLPGGRAVLEMASASGLTLVPPGKRDPSKTTTYGTGELIRAALDAGCRELLIGIGGSSTNDCGVGMAQALGIGCLDSSGQQIAYGGGNLMGLHSIDISRRDPRLAETTIRVACDVDNPLCGPRGAAAVYAPQKGADSQMVQQLDKALEHCSRIMERDVGSRITDIPGSGAAGGLGGGLVGFLDAKLERGIDAVLSMIRFDTYLKGTDVVITGEGQIDRQTVYGKVPVGVAQWTKRCGAIPVIAVTGGVAEGFQEVYKHGIDVVIPIPDRAMPLAESMERGGDLLKLTGERIARLLLIGQDFSQK